MAMVSIGLGKAGSDGRTPSSALYARALFRRRSMRIVIIKFPLGIAASTQYSVRP